MVQGVVFTLAVSLLIAYLLDPVIDWFEVRRIPRTAAIILLVVAACVCSFGFLLWVLPPLTREFARAIQELTLWLKDDTPTIRLQLESMLGTSLEESGTFLRQKAKEYGPQLLSSMGTAAQATAHRTLSAASSLLYIALIPIFVFYFLRDFDRITASAKTLIPLSRKEFLLERFRRCDDVIGEWLRGQVQVALVLAVFYATALSIVGVNLAIPIGLLAGMLSVIPYVGGAIGFLLAMMMALLGWDGGAAALGVIVVFTIANLLEGYVLTPKIVGEKVGLSPVVVLLSLLLGGEAFGLFGVLMAVPVAGIAKTLGSEFLDWYRSSEHYLGDPASTDDTEDQDPEEPSDEG